MKQFAISFIGAIIILFVSFIVLFCCDSRIDKRVSIDKSIHITDKGDTIVTRGGNLNHYSSESYNLYNAE